MNKKGTTLLDVILYITFILGCLITIAMITYIVLVPTYYNDECDKNIDYDLDGVLSTKPIFSHKNFFQKYKCAKEENFVPLDIPSCNGEDYSLESGFISCKDNCPNSVNGPDLGICISGDEHKFGKKCKFFGDCDEFRNKFGVCSKFQQDTDQDGIGDACDLDPCDKNEVKYGIPEISPDCIQRIIDLEDYLNNKIPKINQNTDNELNERATVQQSG